LETLGVKEHKEMGKPIVFNKLDGNKKKGSYEISIHRKSYILIKADDDAGFFYALSSLASLIDGKDNRVDNMFISDEPRYEYRSIFIDVASNFHNKTLIFSLLD